MLKMIRQKIVQNLWQDYHRTTPHIASIEAALKNKKIDQLFLDHFAIIDLPGTHSGIPALKKIFSAIGFQEGGRGYLHDKQNDFLWMAESDSHTQPPTHVLPQVVVADFRLDEMPNDVKNIIINYAEQSTPVPLDKIEVLTEKAMQHDELAAEKLIDLVLNYLRGRDWPLPTIAEFKTVQHFNELLAWVLVFGRRPNHFTLSVHLLPHFSNLDMFHSFITDDVGLALNQEGGTIKGNEKTGIAQGSTAGISTQVALHDGNIELPTGFVEFVWRFPKTSRPIKQWDDYFTGFVASHADHVIESLYCHES